ncbi:hypothetical protein ACH4S8_34825 [Streptomyces sp. NPDC021080]|uniref:hypothetical protein n=1 Tax=Streptomyces sp. NPDC021080 TaxID=3365110 RepID=UPI0037ABFD04
MPGRTLLKVRGHRVVRSDQWAALRSMPVRSAFLRLAVVKSSSGGPNSHSVLRPELMDFFLGETPAKRFATGLAPECGL